LGKFNEGSWRTLLTSGERMARKKKRRREERPKELVLPGEGEILCVVERMLGAEHIMARCLDGKVRMGRIPGRMKKRVWIREGDVVLMVPWEFQGDRKGDIVHRYLGDEVRKLIELGYLPPEFLEGGAF